MSLAAGGHLTHGAAPNLSGKWFHAVQYGVRREDGLLDYDELERLAHAEKPKLIIAGGSAYPRFIDFARIRAVADEVGAYLMVDMAHFAGLVAAGVFPSPLPHAHVVTTTTHKTLRGPRGGMILANDPEIGKKINRAVFPGLQGGPLMHVIAGKAAAFGEALQPGVQASTSKPVADNAKALAATLVERGLAIVSGGTDSHLMLVDLRPKHVTGKAAEASLERAHITCNKNAIPFDPEKPDVTSGIRLGTPAATTRGFGQAEFREVGQMIAEVLDGLGEIQRRHQRRRRGGGRRAGDGAVRPLPDLSAAGGPDACAARSAATTTPRSRTAVRPRTGGDPPPPALRQLRPALHHLRARAAARADGGQEGPAARAVRPRQAGALDPDLAAQAPGRGGARSSASSTPSCASSKARARAKSRRKQIGELVMEALKPLDQVAYVRFASVYRNFREAKDFEEFIGRICGRR